MAMEACLPDPLVSSLIEERSLSAKLKELPYPSVCNQRSKTYVSRFRSHGTM